MQRLNAEKVIIELQQRMQFFTGLNSTLFVSFQIETSDDIEMTHDGAFHRLILKNCKEEDSGKYRFEADGRKTESMLIVEGKGIHPSNFLNN